MQHTTQYHTIFKAPSSLKLGRFIETQRGIFIQFNTDGSMTYFSPTNVLEPTTFQYYPNHDYLLTMMVTAADLNGDGNDQTAYKIEMENLTLGTAAASYTGPESIKWSGSDTNYTLKFGYASTGVVLGAIGPTIWVRGDSATHSTLIRSYLKQLYAGTTSTETTTTTTSIQTQLYDSRQHTLDLYETHKPLTEITLEFQDEAGQLFDPVHGTIEIELNVTRK